MAIRGLEELDQAFRKILEAALAEARETGLEMVVIETYRPQERQDALYAQGRTAPGKVVTWTRHSKHTLRLAADVAPRVDGAIAWNRKDLFDRWGGIAEKHGLAWGGRFKNYDGAHVQAAGA